jgi:two-component system C4-dicarboxylate transport response regulator DctD
MNRDMLIAIVDDDTEVASALSEMLELEGFTVAVFHSAKQVLRVIKKDSATVILSDLRMPTMDGIALLTQVQKIDTSIPVVLMSGHGDIPMAIQAVKQGAQDFLEKPLEPEKLISLLTRILEQRRLVLQSRIAEQSLNQLRGIEKFIIGNSSAIDNVRKSVLALSAANVDTIIYGNTGTGKDVVAQALHLYSPRRDKRFVAINCGGMSESLIESELFGHEAGSFTGASRRHIGKIEAANGGTLFLDEIESMPIAVQIKLLRVLQDRSIERVGSSESIKVQMTVIAASKDDLARLSETGAFRKDLFYRLNVANLSLPDLSERKEDILALFMHHAQQASERYKKDIPELSAEYTKQLLSDMWPGNVRELKNAADRFVLQITHNESLDTQTIESNYDSYDEQMDKFERQLLEEVLTAANGQIKETAELLNLTSKTLYRKMKKHQLDKSTFKANE